MVEKLGHSKRIQVMRREWIEEEKPRPFDSSEPTREMLESLQIPKNTTHINDGDARATKDQDESGGGDLFIPDFEGIRPTTSYPEPEDDDLDDLLREQDEPMADHPSDMAALSSRPPPDNVDDYDAEYEAMKELGM
jgi:replication fork protection complex subunit Csm3/Swi3